MAEGWSQSLDITQPHLGLVPALSCSRVSKRGAFSAECLPSFIPLCLLITVSCLADFMLRSNTAGLNPGSWQLFPLESNSEAFGLPVQPRKFGFAGPSTTISGRACSLRELGADLTHFLHAQEMHRDFRWILHNLILYFFFSKLRIA